MTKKLVVFDMDGTLINGNTWEVFNTKLGVTKGQDDSLYLAFSKNEITYREWQTALKKIYNLSVNKHSKAQVLQYLTEYELKTTALESLKTITIHGHDSLLLTGSFQMTADAVAYELGIPNAIALTNCLFDDAGGLIDLQTSGDEQYEKVTILKHYCEERNISLDDCVVIGDGPNDIPLFLAVKHSVTFTDSSKEACKVASYTINSLSELPVLIEQL